MRRNSVRKMELGACVGRIDYARCKGKSAQGCSVRGRDGAREFDVMVWGVGAMVLGAWAWIYGARMFGARVRRCDSAHCNGSCWVDKRREVTRFAIETVRR